MSEMNLKQFDKYMADLADAPDKWGLGANRKVAAYLKKQHRQRLRKAVGPTGQPWQKTWVPPLAKVGDVAYMELEGGTIVKQPVKTRAGVRAAKRWRKKYGPPMKPQKALVRTAGKKRFRVRKIFDRLVTNVLSTKKTTAKRKALGLDTVTALSYGPRHLMYGYKAGTQWIEQLNYGSTYKGKKVPPREILGMTDQDVTFVKNAYVDAFIKYSKRKG